MKARTKKTENDAGYGDTAQNHEEFVVREHYDQDMGRTPVTAIMTATCYHW